MIISGVSNKADLLDSLLLSLIPEAQQYLAKEYGYQNEDIFSNGKDYYFWSSDEEKAYKVFIDNKYQDTYQLINAY